MMATWRASSLAFNSFSGHRSLYTSGITVWSVKATLSVVNCCLLLAPSVPLRSKHQEHNIEQQGAPALN